MSELDELISQQEARVAKLKALRDALEDKELASMARQYLGADTPVAAKVNIIRLPESQTDAARRIVKRHKSVEQIVTFFEKRNNSSATIAQITEGTKMSAANVRRIVYAAHPDLFKKAGKMLSSREVLFQLSNCESQVEK